MVRIQSPVIVLAIAAGASLVCAAQNNPSRPPITGIATVSVYASDLDKSGQFYGVFLGLGQMAKGTGTPSLEYRVNASQSIEVAPLPSGETDDLAYVAFATADADALRRYLLSKSISVQGAIQTRADGAQVLWVRDPEGHRIQFVQLPAGGYAATTTANFAKLQPVSRHILHAGFVVHDRTAEDHFFRDVLGFREGWQGGSRDGKTDWIDMQVPDGTDWLEYMMYDAAARSAPESGVVNHFALGVPDIHQAADLLQKRQRNSSSREDPQMGRDGKWQLNLYDPVGTRVELMEFGPVRTPCCSPYSLKPPHSSSK